MEEQSAPKNQTGEVTTLIFSFTTKEKRIIREVELYFRFCSYCPPFLLSTSQGRPK